MQSQSRAKVQGVYSETQVISQTGEKQQEYEENTGEGGQRDTGAGHQGGAEARNSGLSGFNVVAGQCVYSTRPYLLPHNSSSII